MQMEKNMNNQDSARVRAWLEQGVLLFDGATGTALRAQAEEGEAVERLCLTQPQRVSALHRGYLAAGCRAIKTNTFAAHVSMACENEEDQRGLILAACRLAQRASGATTPSYLRISALRRWKRKTRLRVTSGWQIFF